MRKFLAFLMSFVLLLSFATTAFADEISTYSNNVNNVQSEFVISKNGTATVSNYCYGISGITKSTKIVTKVQKKVGVIWVTVKDGSWTDESNSVRFSKSHTVKLTDKDNYRAHVVFTISGTGGKDDKITKNVEKTYS